MYSEKLLMERIVFLTRLLLRLYQIMSKYKYPNMSISIFNCANSGMFFCGVIHFLAVTSPVVFLNDSIFLVLL